MHNVELSKCGDIVKILLDNQLFPCSPKLPQLAFSIELLDLYHALILEGHLTHYAFFKALQTIGNLKSIKKVSPLIN